MIGGLLLSAALTLAPAARAQGPAAGAQILNLSCVEALAAVGESRLAGVFSFVAEKDTPGAFADLMVHDRKLLKKWVAKLEKDRKEANGISQWDHDAVLFALQIYGSPLAETVEKPGDLKTDLEQLARVPVLTLAEITARRRKG